MGKGAKQVDPVSPRFFRFPERRGGEKESLEKNPSALSEKWGLVKNREERDRMIGRYINRLGIATSARRQSGE